MRKKNCLCGRSLTKCVAQSTPVATTSLLPPLKGIRLAMPSLPTDPCDADAEITGSRFASLGDAPFYRGSVNTDDGEWHSSDLRQRRTARNTTFMSSGVRWRHFSGGAFVIYQLFTVFVQHTDHSFPVMYILMTRKTTVLYPGVFKKLHALILQYTIYYMWSTQFAFPCIPFPAFFSFAVWCRVFQSHVFRPCIFDRPAFFSLAFSVSHPIALTFPPTGLTPRAPAVFFRFSRACRF